jgi:hypothetical protein
MADVICLSPSHLHVDGSLGICVGESWRADFIPGRAAATAPDTLEPEIIQPMRPFNWQQFNESEMPSEAGTVLRRFANGEKLTVARVSFAAESPMRTRMGSLRHD